MTADQELLAKYLIDLKAPLTCILFVVGSLQTDEMVIEMFRYIAEHPEAEYHELYEVTCRIAARKGLLDAE